jgi:hypothetical protein
VSYDEARTCLGGLRGACMASVSLVSAPATLAPDLMNEPLSVLGHIEGHFMAGCVAALRIAHDEFVDGRR